jgi:alkylation response protein AidB-like acyl-CoA dehydrogenase
VRAVDFELGAEQKEVQALAREFARQEIEPHASEWDREHHFPRDVFQKLAELGLMGACIPEEYGGAGTDFLSYILVLEELSRADAGVGVTVAVHTSAVSLPLLAFGTEEQRARFIPPLARGEYLGAFALTEAGSVPTLARCGPARPTATAGASRVRSSGSRTAATRDLPRVRTHRSGRGKARGRQRVHPRRRSRASDRDEEKLGLNSSVTNDIEIEGAFVGRDRLLHEENRGFRVAMQTLDGGRIGIAAQALGIAQAAYDVAREYAKQRQTFGKPIAQHQAIQLKLADMSTEIEAARLLVYRAAWLKDRGETVTEAGAKAKLFASEVATAVERGDPDSRRLRVHEEFPVERYYRDAKITEIYEGTNEIQRLVIARSILGLQERSLARAELRPAATRTARPAPLPRFPSRRRTRSRGDRAARRNDRPSRSAGTSRG